MNKNHISLLIGTVALFFSISTHAEIYKWVDAKGVTHYTATPPPQKTIKHKTKVENIEVQILSAAGKFKPATNQTSSDEKTSGMESKKTDNKLSPPGKKLVSYCKKQRGNLANLKGNYFNVWVDDKGKETKLDQKERQEKVDHLINDIKDNCKGV